MTLKDAIGKDVFILDDTRYTDNDLQAMTTGDLETLKVRVHRKVNDLATELKAKQIEYASGGNGAEPLWFRKCKTIFTINQNMLPYLNRLLRQRHRSDKKLGDVFMDQARELLKPEYFDAVLTSAQKEMQREGA